MDTRGGSREGTAKWTELSRNSYGPTNLADPMDRFEGAIRGTALRGSDQRDRCLPTTFSMAHGPISQSQPDVGPQTDQNQTPTKLPTPGRNCGECREPMSLLRGNTQEGHGGPQPTEGRKDYQGKRPKRKHPKSKTQTARKQEKSRDPGSELCFRIGRPPENTTEWTLKRSRGCSRVSTRRGITRQNFFFKK